MRGRTKKLFRKGFTLPELLIVVVVLAILAAIAVTAVKNFSSSAKADAVMDAYNKISKAANMFATDTEYYPDAVAELWKNDDGNGNPIPNWKGPYLTPPGGNTNLTTYPVEGLQAQIVCTEGGPGTGEVHVEITGDGLAPKLANEVVDKLGSDIASYDSANNKLTLVVTKAEAVSGQHIYCK